MVSSPTFCHGDGVFGIVGLITSIWINIFLIIWIIGWIIWINNTIFIIYYNINNINMDDIFSYYLILLVSSISLSPLDSKSKSPHEIPMKSPIGWRLAVTTAGVSAAVRAGAEPAGAGGRRSWCLTWNPTSGWKMWENFEETQTFAIIFHDFHLIMYY